MKKIFLFLFCLILFDFVNAQTTQVIANGISAESFNFATPTDSLNFVSATQKINGVGVWRKVNLGQIKTWINSTKLGFKTSPSNLSATGNNNFRNSFVTVNGSKVKYVVDSLGVAYELPGDITVTTTGSGSATYNKVTGVLNIPQKVDLQLTTNGTSGSATYNSTTGQLNIPKYEATSFDGIAYVSKYGDNTTAILGDRFHPFSDPIAARKSLELANVNNGLVEVLSGNYLVCDTDTAIWRTSQKKIPTADKTIIVTSSQALNKNDWTLSPQSVSILNYYWHAGTSFSTMRVKDSFPTPMFHDTVGRSVNVYGKGTFIDGGTYYVINGNSTVDNDNWGFRDGRVFEMKKNSTAFLECAKLLMNAHGLYVYGGIPVSDSGQGMKNFSTSDSLNRNWNLKSLIIYADSIITTHRGGLLNIDFRNSRHLSDRTGLTKGFIYIKSKFYNTSGGGWNGMESFNNYDVIIDCDFADYGNFNFIGLRNGNYTFLGRVARNVGYWSIGDYTGANVLFKFDKATNVSGMGIWYPNDSTRNHRLTVEISDLETTNQSQAQYGYQGGCFDFPNSTDTSNTFVIKNTSIRMKQNFLAAPTYNGFISVYGLWTLRYDLDRLSSPKLIVQNSSYSGKSNNGSIVGIRFVGNPIASRFNKLNVLANNVIYNNADVVSSGSSLNFPIQSPVVSSEWKTW